MRITSVLIVFLTLAVCDSVSVRQDGDYLPSVYGMQNIATYCDTEAKLAIVRAYENHPSFDFLRIPKSRQEPVEILVAADAIVEFKTILQRNGIHFKVMDEDVSKMIRKSMNEDGSIDNRFGPRTLSLTYFPRYEEIQAYLEEVGKSNNSFIKYHKLGNSFEGREIGAIKFSTGGQGKPILLIDAGIHAREWVAPTTALYAIKELAENSYYRYLYENIDIYIIPLLNPDGYEYTFVSEETRLWRKTRSDIPDSTCKGVDGNRNFDFNWNIVGASPIPCMANYAGNRPFSEPETRALRDFVLARRDRIKVYLSFHSYGNYFLYPWGYTKDLPANEPILRCVATMAVAELNKVRGTTYRIGSSTNMLYAAAGGSDDWTMGYAGVDLAYTVELPGSSFAPSTSEIIPIGQETFEAIKVFTHYINGEICRNSPVNY